MAIINIRMRNNHGFKIMIGGEKSQVTIYSSLS